LYVITGRHPIIASWPLSDHDANSDTQRNSLAPDSPVKSLPSYHPLLHAARLEKRSLSGTQIAARRASQQPDEGLWPQLVLIGGDCPIVTLPRRRRRSIPCGCIAVICFVAFALGAGIAVAQRRAPGGPLDVLFGPRLPEWTTREPVTLLLLGTDKRQWEAAPGRSDTIILAMLDSTQRHVAILSIPRDLWVAIPGYGENRINTAFFYGQALDVPAGGPGLAALTVEYAFGVPVDYWAVIDFQGFERIVDSFGGITVDVPYDIEDNAYPDGNYGVRRVYIPAGQQHMDGATALIYARTRHGSSDFERARRQQQIIRALLAKAMSPAILPRLPLLAQNLSDIVDTNASPTALLALASLARQGDEVTLDCRVIDESLAHDFVTATGAQVLLPDSNGIDALVREAFSPLFPQEEILANIGIRVQNASGLPLLTQQTVAFLQGLGATVTEAIDQSNEPLDRSMLYVHAPAPAAEQYLQRLFKLQDETVIRTADGPPQTHMTLVLGRDVIAGG